MAERILMLKDATGAEHRAAISRDGVVMVNGSAFRIERAPDGSLDVRTGADERRRVWSVRSGDLIWIFLDGDVFTFEPEGTAARRRGAGYAGSLEAPMPATVRAVRVKPGDAVSRGDVLVLLEAMKMELPVRAGTDGRVAEVRCQEGEMVQAGQLLVRMEDA